MQSKQAYLGYPSNSQTLSLLHIHSPHKFFKCWWLALAEQKTITKPLINSSFNSGPPEVLICQVPTIILELLRQFEWLIVIFIKILAVWSFFFFFSLGLSQFHSYIFTTAMNSLIQLGSLPELVYSLNWPVPAYLQEPSGV